VASIVFLLRYWVPKVVEVVGSISYGVNDLILSAALWLSQQKRVTRVSPGAAFLKLWSADHKWSSGSALMVRLD